MLLFALSRNSKAFWWIKKNKKNITLRLQLFQNKTHKQLLIYSSNSVLLLLIAWLIDYGMLAICLVADDDILIC